MLVLYPTIAEKMKKEIIIGIVAIILIVAVNVGLIWFTAIIIDADEYECNWIWCEFKKTVKEIECYENGEPINCSEISEMYDEYLLENKRQNES